MGFTQTFHAQYINNFDPQNMRVISLWERLNAALADNRYW